LGREAIPREDIMSGDENYNKEQPYLEGVLEAIRAERIRQDLKWGVQSHPDQCGGPEMTLLLSTDFYRLLVEHEAKNLPKGPSWKAILLEEVAEAVEAEDADERVNELTHVAAVVVAWIEDIKRRNAHVG
jgi:hypothetical protein